MVTSGPLRAWDLTGPKAPIWVHKDLEGPIWVHKNPYGPNVFRNDYNVIRSNTFFDRSLSRLILITSAASILDNDIKSKNYHIATKTTEAEPKMRTTIHQTDYIQ